MTPPRERREGKVVENPRRLALAAMRDMKRVLLETVRAWDIPATITERRAPTRHIRIDRQWAREGYTYADVEYEVESWTTRDRRSDECPENSPEQWLLLWHTAINLRDSADRLAAYCKQEHARVTEEQP